jgi:hypothetical protein
LKQLYLIILILLSLPSISLGEIIYSKGQYKVENASTLNWNLVSSYRKMQIANSLETLVLATEKFIPLELKHQIIHQTIIVKVVNDLPSDGLFVDPPNYHHFNIVQESPHDYFILVKKDLLLSNDFERVLLHEYFHLVHYLINPGEDAWIREGLAQMFELMVLGTPNAFNLKSSFETKYIKIDGVYDFLKPDPAQYGVNLLHLYYVLKECGGDKLFWEIAKGDSGLKGIDIFDQSLKKMESTKEQCQDYDSSVISFQIARIHNKVSYNISENKTKNYLLPTNIKYIPEKIGTFLDLNKLKNKKMFNHPFIPEQSLLSSILKSDDFVCYNLNQKFPYSVEDANEQSFNALCFLIKK